MDQMDPIRNIWRASTIHALFYSILAQEILKIRISTDSRTKFIWTPSSSGRFTTSSAYSLVIAPTSNTSSYVSSFCWKSIWKLNLNDRLRLFLWKIAWSILLSKVHLGKLFLIFDTYCPLCKVADDSLTHLFFECFFAQVVWRLSFWPLDSIDFHFSSLLDWINSIISPGRSLGIPSEDQHKFQIFASVACDILWFYRNKALHDEVSLDARSVSAHINKISLEHFLAWRSSAQVLVEKWSPLPLNWVKINFDTAIRDYFSAQAVVCRDSLGRVLHLSSQISPPCSLNVGEAHAALLACSLASSFFLWQIYS